MTVFKDAAGTSWRVAKGLLPVNPEGGGNSKPSSESTQRGDFEDPRGDGAFFDAPLPTNSLYFSIGIDVKGWIEPVSIISLRVSDFKYAMSSGVTFSA